MDDPDQLRSADLTYAHAALDLVAGDDLDRGVPELVEATLPVTPSNETLPTASTMARRWPLTSSVLEGDLEASMIAFAASYARRHRRLVGEVRGLVVGEELLARFGLLGRLTDRGREVAIGGGTRELDERRVVDAVATHERDVETRGLHLLRERPGLRVLTAVDRLGLGRSDLGDDRAVVGLVRVDRLGGDDGAAAGLEGLVK